MSLANISKEHLDNLFVSLYQDTNTLDLVKCNHVNFARLKQLAKQMNYLKQEALEIIEETRRQNQLFQIKPRFKLVSGNNYFVYQKDDGTQCFSLIAPSEWETKDEFVGKYFYDFDKQFVLL